MQRTAAAAPTFDSPLEFVDDLSDQEEPEMQPLAPDTEEDREGKFPYIRCSTL